jgi:hypothetical protein
MSGGKIAKLIGLILVLAAPMTLAGPCHLFGLRTGLHEIFDRAKTGPNQGRIEFARQQPSSISSLTNDDGFLTERAGFEPAIGFKPNTAFPVLLLRPLGHLSRRSTLGSSRQSLAEVGGGFYSLRG